MNGFNRATPILLVVLFITLVPLKSEAATYQYDSVVTLCTSTCDDFASLELGSTINGTIQIQVGADSNFDDADIVTFSFEVFNPNLPVSGPVGDPFTDNPMLIDLTTAASNGSAGSTDANVDIVGGQILLEFIVSPFNDNGAFAIFDPVSGISQVCLFYATAGCIPGATEAVIYEGDFVYVPPAELIHLDGFETE